MHYYFMKMKSMNAHTMSEETVTCTAVKEDRHQKHHEQRCVEEGSRRAVDNRKSGEIHGLAWLP